MDFHARAVKADKEAREETKKMLIKKYPYIDLNQFKILTHIDGDAKAHPEVVFMDKSSGREIDVHMDRGKHALVAMKPRPPFPKLWSGAGAGGTIQVLPKGKAHGRLH